MIIGEVLIRIWNLFKLIGSFGIISIINAILIRVAIKCSELSIFPILYCYECLTRRQFNPDNMARLYQLMGSQGALSAYLDRHQLSNDGLRFSIFTALFIYYVMYMASYTFWDKITFNNTFSG